MKFGGYKVNFKTLRKSKHADGSIHATAEISGLIEIGIEIDKFTWRGDWLAEKILKDKAHDYRISSIINNIIPDYPITEKNIVSVVFQPIGW